MATLPPRAAEDSTWERPQEEEEAAVADRAGCLLMLVSAGVLSGEGLSPQEFATLVQLTPLTWAHAACALASSRHGTRRGGDEFARLRAAHDVTHWARVRVLHERALAARAAQAALRIIHSGSGECPWLAIGDREAAPREEPAGSPARRLDAHLDASCRPILDVLAAVHPSVERAVAGVVPAFVPARSAAASRSERSHASHKFYMSLERRVAARRVAAELAARAGRASTSGSTDSEADSGDTWLDLRLLRDVVAAGSTLWPADEVEKVVGAALRVWLPPTATAATSEAAAPADFGAGERAWDKLAGLLAPSAPLMAAESARAEARRWCLRAQPAAAAWPAHSLAHSLGAWLAAVVAATGTVLRLRPVRLTLPLLCSWARDAAKLLTQLWGLHVPFLSHEAAEASAQALTALAQATPEHGEARLLLDQLSHRAHDGAHAVQRACERAVWRVMWPLVVDRARREGRTDRSSRAFRHCRSRRPSARACGVRLQLWLDHTRDHASKWEGERLVSFLQAAAAALVKGTASGEAQPVSPAERVAWLAEAVVRAIPCSVLAAQRGTGAWTFERREQFAMCVGRRRGVMVQCWVGTCVSL